MAPLPLYTCCCPPELVGWTHTLLGTEDLDVLVNKNNSTIYALSINGVDIALKKCSKLLQSAHDKVLYEIALTADLCHPNVLPLYGAYEHDGALYLISPLAKCSLMDLMGKTDTPYNKRSTIAADIGAALRYIHGKRIIHRDIKLENIFLLGDKLVLADFGEAVSLDNPPAELTIAGTAMYFAPEVARIHPTISRKEFDEQVLLQQLSPKCDVYALGILLFALDFDYYPFDLNMPHDEYNNLPEAAKISTTADLFHSIVQDEVEYDDGVAPLAMEFYDSVLAKHAEQRMSLEELLRHPYVLEDTAAFEDDECAEAATAAQPSDAQLVRDLHPHLLHSIRKVPSESMLDKIAFPARPRPHGLSGLGGEFSLEDLMEDSEQSKEQPSPPGLSCRSLPLATVYNLNGLPPLILAATLGNRRNSSTNSLRRLSRRSRASSGLESCEVKPSLIALPDDSDLEASPVETSPNAKAADAEAPRSARLRVVLPSEPVTVPLGSADLATMDTVMEDEVVAAGATSRSSRWLRSMMPGRAQRTTQDSRTSTDGEDSSRRSYDDAHDFMSPGSSSGNSIDDDGHIIVVSPNASLGAPNPAARALAGAWNHAKRFMCLSPNSAMVANH